MGRVIKQEHIGTVGNLNTIKPFIFRNAVYDSASQLISLETDSGQENLEYDSLGNLILWESNSGRKEFVYDYDNKQKAMKIGNKEIKFSYNPLDYRLKKETDNKVYEYFYGVDGNLLYERIFQRGNLKEERYYVYISGKLDRPVAMVIKKGNRYKTYYYIHNHQGSVIAVADNKGKIVNFYDYWPDGNIRNIDEKIEQPFLYTGAYYDRETGLHYLRARYYSPELRRFIQRDPILFEGGINLYNYTGCDFVNYGDWWGLDSDPIVKIQNLYKVILEHIEKIRKEPNSQALNHWKKEIKERKREIEQTARRVVKKRKGSFEKNIDKILKESYRYRA